MIPARLNGGDAVSDHTSYCSSGFGVIIAGQKRLLTAGHCFLQGESVYNTEQASGGTSMGTISENRMVYQSPGEYSGIDTAHTSSQGSDLIYTGTLSNPQVSTVSGTYSLQIGDQVCQSGVQSGEICNITIQQTNVTQVFYDGLGIIAYTGTHMDVGESPTGTVPARAGDSGGPVFHFVGSALYAAGTVSAASGRTLYFTDIHFILQTFSATINNQP